MWDCSSKGFSPNFSPVLVSYRINIIFRPTVNKWKYEVVSKIFQTGAAIYTAVVVVRSTGLRMWEDDSLPTS
jgi:hypothetical protein